MYLSCTESPWPTDNGAKTRGTKVTTASISSLGVCASVYPAANTYTSAGCGSYFYKESVSSGTPTSYYWPTSGYKISFFAYYPYNNAAFTVQSAANVTGAPTYAYTVPSVISNQLDIMTGQVTDQLGGSSSAVNMSLVHRCSAIHFNITNDRSDAITVNSISIEGVKYTGTLNESTWTLGSGVNSSSTNPFTLTCNTSVSAGATTDITGSSNIFLMLPQSLPSGATLKVVVDDEEFETDLSGTWVAGKEYTYTISMSEGCIDLSMVDNAGNKRATMTTANCYLVHAAGKYKIPLVYGNAIKNGEVNTVAFYPDVDGPVDTNATRKTIGRCKNYNNRDIQGPWITKNGSGIDAGDGFVATRAILSWQDVQGLITEVGIDGNYLTFTVGTFNEGNALISIKNSSSLTLWSWHIWATENDLSNTTVVATGSHNYTVAPVNLGWVPTSVDGKQGYCTYYQWGRKDPFIPAAAYNSSSNHSVYTISNGYNSGISYEKGQQNSLTLGYNIIYPTKYLAVNVQYVPSYYPYANLWDAQNSSMTYDGSYVSTATKKTIYDPCPPGFCVPTSNLFYFMSNEGNNRTMTTWDTTNKGAIWNTGITGDELWFPAAGGRFNINSDSNLSSVGTKGVYMCATPYGANYQCSLEINTSNWNVSGQYTQAWKSWAGVIRPVAEE
jgi:hypothetical protein